MATSDDTTAELPTPYPDDEPITETQEAVKSERCSQFPPASDPPLTFDPSWRTETVVALATGIFIHFATDRLPILADALEEAGCDHPLILNHCRTCPHPSGGCWVVHLALGHTTVAPKPTENDQDRSERLSRGLRPVMPRFFAPNDTPHPMPQEGRISRFVGWLFVWFWWLVVVPGLVLVAADTAVRLFQVEWVRLVVIVPVLILVVADLTWRLSKRILARKPTAVKDDHSPTGTP